MRLEHSSLSDLKKELLRICDTHLPKGSYLLFFFGSRVTGKGSEHSDIDVGIEAAQKIPLELMAKIKEDIERLPTLYTIEIVDFCSVSQEFRKVALEKTEPLVHE